MLALISSPLVCYLGIFISELLVSLSELLCLSSVLYTVLDSYEYVRSVRVLMISSPLSES